MIAKTLALVVDSDVLARIGGPLGEAAREHARELAVLEEKAARAQRASWLAAARAPIPSGIRGIDASWIDPAIASIGASLATRARRVLFDGPATEGDVWLARWLCAAFPPMPAIDDRIARPRNAIEVVSMSPVNVRAWLEDIGADQIAFAVGAAATAISTRLGAAATRIAVAPRAGELGDRRSAIERARIAIDEGALLRVGARTIAPRLGHLERWQLAHRLPREMGVMAELEAFAGSVGAPSWKALAAS